MGVDGWICCRDSTFRTSVRFLQSWLWLGRTWYCFVLWKTKLCYTVLLYTDLRPEIVVALVDRFHYLHFGAFSFLFSGLVRAAYLLLHLYYYLLCRLVWGSPC